MADLLEGPTIKSEMFSTLYDDRTGRPLPWLRQLTTAWQQWFNRVAICVNILAKRVQAGEGDPNGVIYASPGTLYLRSDGGAGTSLYVKESALSLNTGWAPK